MNATGASGAGTLSESFSITVDTLIDGKISIRGIETDTLLSGSETLINLNFDVVGLPKDSTGLVFDHFIFNNGTPVAETVNGKFLVDMSTAIEDPSDGNSSLPTVFKLKQNFPNPFNPSTNIEYTLPRNSHVTLKIFNLLGKEVATLVDERQQTESYEIQWQPRGLQSGVYF